MSVEKDEHENEQSRGRAVLPGGQAMSATADVSASADFLTASDARFIPGTSRYELLPMSGASCELDAERHCITGSDEALPASGLRIASGSGWALAEVSNQTEA